MKIIISENQELKAKKKIIFFLLDKQKYNLVEINDSIYFAKNIGDVYSEIKYNKSDGWCGISHGLISFLSTITGFEWSEVQELIGKWVEHTLQMEVRYNRLQSGNFLTLVEHTLQMEVRYNIKASAAYQLGLNVPYN